MADKGPENEPEKGLWRQLFEASSVGIQLVLSTFAGLAIGYGLDKLFGTSPYLTFLCLILGIISGFRELFKVARKTEGKKNGSND